MKKYSLTPEHRAQLKPWADRWIANAMSTKAMDDHDKTEMKKAIRGLYEAANLTPPPDDRIIFVPSPFVARFAGGFAAGVWWLRKNKKPATRDATDDATDDATVTATYAATYDATRDATVTATYDATYAATYDATHDATYDATYAATDDAMDDLSKWVVVPGNIRSIARLFGDEKFLMQCAVNAWRLYQGGNFWSGWTAYLSFFRHVAKIDLPIYDKFDHWEKATIHGSWRMMHAEFCIVSDRPELLTVDEQRRPHNATGPFCMWRDGSRLYSWHGIRVPAWCIEQKDKITKETIIAEDNTEIRRAMCEIVGWDRAMEMFGGRTIDADECLGLPRALIETTISGERVRLLRMTNGTVENGVRRQFVEGVPLTVQTCHEAVAWQCGVSAKFHQEGVRT